MTQQLDSATLIIGEQASIPTERGSLGQLRIATLIWFSLNTLFALLLVFRVYYHATRDEREIFRQRFEEATSQGKIVTEAELRGKRTWRTVLRVPTDEVFPLVLAIGLAVQGAIFTRFVASGLDAFPPGEFCGRKSEILWTSLWIPVYTTFVFEVECLIRTLSSPRLQPRGKHTTQLCIASIIGLLFVTWIPTHFMKVPKNTLCNGQIMQFLNHFSSGGMGLFGLLVPITVAISIIITMHLSRAVPVDETERRSAKKVVYFSFNGALQWALVIPFFATSNATKINRPLLFLASVILGMSSIFANSLYFYLRSKLKFTSSPTIPPKDIESTLPRRFHQVTDRLPVNATPPMSDRTSNSSGDQDHISKQILSILSSDITSPVSQLHTGLSGSTAQPTPLHNPRVNSPLDRRMYSPSTPGPVQIPEVSRSTQPHPLRHARTYSLADKPPAPRPASVTQAYHGHSRNSSTSSSTGLLSTIEGSLPITYDGDSRHVSMESRLVESRRWTGRQYTRGSKY